MFRRFSFTLIGLALWLHGCGSDSSPTSSTPPPGSSTVTVEIRDNLFDPRSISVAPGTTVQWILRGNASDHTVTDNQAAFDSGLIFRNAGDTFQRRFTEEGRTFNYICTTHEAMGMRGSVRVGQNAPPPDPGY